MMLIVDEPEFKMRVDYCNPVSPFNTKGYKIIRELYNKEGELTSSTSYEFYIPTEKILLLMKAFMQNG